jgi:hypothetical protein
MKRSTMAIGLALPQIVAIMIALVVGVSRADECPNKFNAPKDVSVFEFSKEDAEKEYKGKIKEYAEDLVAECNKHKCKKGKQCTPIHVETPSKCFESEQAGRAGWACTGTFRGGCFCFTAAEKPKGAVPAPPNTAKPPETASECENKFGDQVDILGIGDDDTKAKTAHTQSLKDRIDLAAKDCSEKKCPDGTNQCRMYYTVTDPPKCEANPDKSIGGSICKSKFRAGCFCLGAKEELLAALLGTAPTTGEEYAAAPERPFRGEAMLAGIVYAPGCVPDELCTARLVPEAEAKEIKKTSKELVVEEVSVPEFLGSHAHAKFRGQVVNTKQAKRQPADGPLTFKMPPTGTTGTAMTAMTLVVTPPDKPDERVTVPIENLPPPSEKQPYKHASAPPVIPDNGICVVHDQLSGNGHATKISMNGTNVPVFVESPSEVAFRPGDVAQTGKNEFTITDQGTTKTYEAWNPALTIDANQNTLEQNQSTQFHVRVTGLGGIPGQCWASPGSTGAAEGGGGGGFVLLTIKNNSENTARMSGGNVIVLTLHEADIVDGNYTYEGTITAQEPGPFEIEASIEAHLAEAPPTRIAHGRGGPIAKGAPIGCCQYSNPASGNWCADETENECLGTWKGTNWKCNQNGRCGLNIPLGGGK